MISPPQNLYDFCPILLTLSLYFLLRTQQQILLRLNKSCFAQLRLLFSIVSTDADKINTKIGTTQKILFSFDINIDFNRNVNIEIHGINRIKMIYILRRWNAYPQRLYARHHEDQNAQTMPDQNDAYYANDMI